jgi:probable rRNA maturation factor
MPLPSDWRERTAFVEAVTAFVESVVRATLTAEGERHGQVGIFIADDETIQRFNSEYRGVDAPTDVLAFAMRDGVDANLHPELLGDIVLSLPTAFRQAAEVGHSLEREVAFLTIHATLHLLGYDHVEDRDAEAMERRERELFAALTRSATWCDNAFAATLA